MENVSYVVLHFSEKELFGINPLYHVEPEDVPTLNAFSRQQQTEMLFTGDIYSNMSRDDLLKVSHKPQDLVVNCEFERSPSHQMCKEFRENAADTAIFSSKYGVCYTLNSGMGTNGSRGPIKTRETGATEGLSLVLNLECENFILFQKIFKNSSFLEYLTRKPDFFF